jgi:predicted enzyme related to lactoylglutathione lyase
MYSNDLGGISWIDLTVENAEQARDFYRSVVGFEFEGLPMGGYDDFVMKSPVDSDAQVGICHAKGPNADIPPHWLIYFNVADINDSMDQCLALGGEVIRDRSDMGSYEMCILRDPSGAAFALISKKPAP